MGRLSLLIWAQRFFRLALNPHIQISNGEVENLNDEVRARVYIRDQVVRVYVLCLYFLLHFFSVRLNFASGASAFCVAKKGEMPVIWSAADT